MVIDQPEWRKRKRKRLEAALSREVEAEAEAVRKKLMEAEAEAHDFQLLLPISDWQQSFKLHVFFQLARADI